MAMLNWYREADKKTRRIFWTCSAGWAMDMADGVVYSYLIPVLVGALGMTLAQAGFISSVNYFAAALGGWIGGWLCDRYGRARILQPDDPVVLGVLLHQRLRAELRADARRAHAAGPRLRRRMGRGGGAARRGHPAQGPRQGARHGAQRRGRGLGAGGAARGPGGGGVRSRPRLAESSSGAASCPPG